MKRGKVISVWGIGFLLFAAVLLWCPSRGLFAQDDIFEEDVFNEDEVFEEDIFDEDAIFDEDIFEEAIEESKLEEEE
jgi:hypothetical protein